ncbi:MAG: ABC transporter ATP-binding protein [Victivallales bacterium]|nr:ABC transporter ATP-binding protein [Victivallales bacterium]MCF7888588.1 ABC transporter ATP-binding protein [Victivallales bacterium]
MSIEKEILNVKNLQVSFDTYAGEVNVLRGINFHLNKGESLAIVGESGSGKSVTVQTVMKLIPMPPGKIKEGKIIYNSKNIAELSEKEMQNIRGRKIGMIFQNPMSSLNPTMKIGKQITESILLHQKASKKKAMAKAVELLSLVGIPNPEKRIKQFPHQFSGGMQQRVVIAIAIACNPEILIADEPTTALDVTIQAQILELMRSLKSRFNTSIILITHDLGVVSEFAERVVVMYGGEIMEEAKAKDLFFKAEHPYTWGLMNSMPRFEDEEKKPLQSIPGTPPDLLKPSPGCPFAPRCIYAMKICRKKKPTYFKISEEHICKCWLQHDDAQKPEKPFLNRKL